MSERDTIFAFASGAPPAAIAVVRISGPHAVTALIALCRGAPPPPRVLALRNLVADDDSLIDRALVVRFTAPASATGEDVVELHLHGGGAVVAAVSAALARLGLRVAQPGEFTRRAFANRRLDLAQVEGLAALVAAETDAQRRAALAGAAGDLSRRIAGWQARLTALRADTEAALDFADGEDDVAARLGDLGDLAPLCAEIAAEIDDRPRARAIADGLRVVVSGPPNTGKSSLVNALARAEVALTSPLPGTTRDAVSVRIDVGGVLVTLVDTAGLRTAVDPIEAAGIARARAEADRADLILATFAGGPPPAVGQPVRTMIDLGDGQPGWRDGILGVSSLTGAGMADLIAWLATWARGIARPDAAAPIANARQHAALADAAVELTAAGRADDLVLRAEHFRRAAAALGDIVGAGSNSDVFEAIFARFCIGK